MSKMIQIRNVPDEVHRKLKIRAARERLSLSDLLLREATRLAETPSLEEWLERLSESEPVELGEPIENAVRAIRGT